MVYNNPRTAYKVEFFDETGDTFGLLTVEEDVIELKTNNWYNGSLKQNEF